MATCTARINIFVNPPLLTDKALRKKPRGFAQQIAVPMLQLSKVEGPEIVRKYNHAVGGIDLLDQLMSYYRTFIKLKKWPLRMIFHASDLAVVQAFREYEIDNDKSLLQNMLNTKKPGLKGLANQYHLNANKG
ncbi:unnamed protein product [Leptidea sinapis]|uniref:PiggyBac transposable element-derived protein domain-containing protein n=1 Tax=Leptidea sinapis TaxID=189913 RepID=A0A5E4QL44_9NEOP|nr:unnamed protein product [Leptidea sinapis]